MKKIMTTMTIEQKHSFLLLVIGLFFSFCIGFFDESNYSLSFLSDLNELRNIIFFAVAFSIIPLVLFNIAFRRKTRKVAFYFSLVGFLPAVLILLFAIN